MSASARGKMQKRLQTERFLEASRKSHSCNSLIADDALVLGHSVPQTNAPPAHLVCPAPVAHISIKTFHTVGIRTATNPNAGGPCSVASCDLEWMHVRSHAAPFACSHSRPGHSSHFRHAAHTKGIKGRRRVRRIGFKCIGWADRQRRRGPCSNACWPLSVFGGKGRFTTIL